MYGAEYHHWREAEAARTELRLERQRVLSGLSDEARALIEADDHVLPFHETFLREQRRLAPTTNSIQHQQFAAMAFAANPPRSLFGFL